MLVPGWNFYDDNADTRDVKGHGTMVAGVAAASSNNAAGVASVAWQCRLMPVRVSDATGTATNSRIAAGLTWAADHGARVANVSFSCTGSSTVRTAAEYFRSKGGVVILSAGNDGGVITTMADNPAVITVSATDSGDNLYSWSNSGTIVDLAAPGNVYTTARGGGYTSASGTSFSAPLVAGVAALVLSVNPELSADSVEDILFDSADDRGAAGWDGSFGWGRVNAARAVTLAGGGALDTTPPTLAFTSPAAGAALSGTAQVQASASDNAGVAQFYVDGILQATTTAAPHGFAWNTSGWSNGAHTLSAVATDTSGNVASAALSVLVSNVADTSAPVVSITSPQSGTVSGSSLGVTAGASDNVGVVRVELWVDGKLSATDTSAPYSFSVNTRKWTAGAAHTLVCRAFDAAGNVGISAPVTVSK